MFPASERLEAGGPGLQSCSPAPSLLPQSTRSQAGCPSALGDAVLYLEVWHGDREGQVVLRWYLAPAGEGSVSPGGLCIADLGSQIKIEAET